MFLLDCDNTLLDNDRVQADLSEHLEREFGAENRDRYWKILEALREELGYTDYLGALQRYRLAAMNEPRLLWMSSYLVDRIRATDNIEVRLASEVIEGRGDGHLESIVIAERHTEATEEETTTTWLTSRTPR